MDSVERRSAASAHHRVWGWESVGHDIQASVTRADTTLKHPDGDSVVASHRDRHRHLHGNLKCCVRGGIAWEIAAELTPFLDLRHSAGALRQRGSRSQRVIQSAD